MRRKTVCSLVAAMVLLISLFLLLVGLSTVSSILMGLYELLQLASDYIARPKSTKERR